MAILRAYADESESDDVYVVAGYVSLIDVWDTVSAEWSQVLGQEPAIDYYRTNEALGLKKQFQGMDDAIRNMKMAKLASCLPTENFWSIASHLRKRDFEEFFTPNFDSYWDNPYYICAFDLALRTAYRFYGQGVS